jgi:hypothetical protein
MGSQGKIFMGRLRAVHHLVAAATLMALAPASPAFAKPASDSDAASLVKVIEAFGAAQGSFDQAALTRLTTTDYVEVSPIGDVDLRDRMIGFYAPDKKRPAPTIVVSDPLVRNGTGGTLVIVRLAFRAPGAAADARLMEMRGSFLLRRIGSEWKIAFAQYTPRRPSR